MHRVALVEARAEHNEAIEPAAENRVGGVARAGVTEHAKRQLVILGKHPLGAKRRGHGYRPAFGDVQQAHGGGIVLDPGADQKGDAPALGIGDELQRRLRRPHAQGPRVGEEGLHLDVVSRAFAGEGVMGQREMNRPTRLRPHGCQRMAEPMIEVLAAADRLGQARERRHDGRVVKGGLARVLEHAAAFHVERHLAGHHQHRRAIGLRGGDRGRHVAGAGAADAKRGTEAAARPRIAIRHEYGAALVRGDHRRELVLPRERRHERIDQAAGDHEQVAEALLRQRVQDVIGAELRFEFRLGLGRRNLGMRGGGGVEGSVMMGVKSGGLT